MTIILPWWCVPILCIAFASYIASCQGERLGVTLLILLAGVVAASSFIAGRFS